jgi:hypothetical protein
MGSIAYLFARNDSLVFIGTVFASMVILPLSIWLAWSTRSRALTWLGVGMLTLTAAIVGWIYWSYAGLLLALLVAIVSSWFMLYFWQNIIFVPDNTMLITRRGQNTLLHKGPSMVKNINPFTDIICARLPLYEHQLILAAQQAPASDIPTMNVVALVYYALRSDEDWDRVASIPERAKLSPAARDSVRGKNKLDSIYWRKILEHLVQNEGERLLRQWIADAGQLSHLVDTAHSTPDVYAQRESGDNTTLAHIQQRWHLFETARTFLDTNMATWGLRMTRVEFLIFQPETAQEAPTTEQPAASADTAPASQQPNPYHQPADTTEPQQPCSLPQALALIEKPAGDYRYELKAIELILEHSQMQPQHIQAICREAMTETMQQQTRTITARAVETALTRVANLPGRVAYASSSYSEATAI